MKLHIKQATIEWSHAENWQTDLQMQQTNMKWQNEKKWHHCSFWACLTGHAKAAAKPNQCHIVTCMTSHCYLLESKIACCKNRSIAPPKPDSSTKRTVYSF